MKTFDDLVFKPHAVLNGKQARLDFDNGYGVSVVRSKDFAGRYFSYTKNEDEWEVAVFKNGDLCYDTHITDDVIGHCSEDKVTSIMREIQELERVEE